MIDFIFENPCKIIFGRKALSHLGEEAARYGDKALLVYGGGQIKRMGLYDQVMGLLAEKGIQVWELGGIRPNPMLSRVYEGIELCRKHGIGLVLAVGGGSVIDTAKSISVGAVYDGDVWNFHEGKAVPVSSLAVGTVPTIAAAGSEMSYSSVITNEDGMRKKGFNALANVPKFSILNPEYCFTLPPYQTACGVVDILAHLMERYFTRVEHVMLTDQMIEACMRTVIAQGPIAMAHPEDYDARAELTWAGALAHNTLMQTGRVGDWGSHKLDHELSALYDIAHGAGLAIVFPAWMKYVLPHAPAKLRQFAVQVFGVPENFGDEEAVALEGIRRLEAFYRSLGMPTRLGEAGIGEDRLEEMADRATSDGLVGVYLPLDREAALAIYRLMK
ncbi:MAG: iron-containing alcohol dehydrogenase [Candidatus Limiplasma sp.]|nr:iron-containing alcohol dehydrogenase [Candidatus Limiplasma sp.]